MSYEDALCHPFKPSAKGARCPDQHAFPTACYSITTNFTVFCNNTQGNCDFLVTPSPVNSILTSCSGLTNIQAVPPAGTSQPLTMNGTNVAVMGSFLTNQSGPQTNPVGGDPPLDSVATKPISSYYPPGVGFFAGNFQGTFGGACNPKNITDIFEDFRVVGYGARIRSLLPPLNQSGQIIVASVPSPDYQPPMASSTLDEWLAFCEYPDRDTSGFLTSAMLNLPVSDMNMYAELTKEGGLEWAGRITGPGAFQFKDPEFSSITFEDVNPNPTASTNPTAAQLVIGPSQFGYSGIAPAPGINVSGDVAPWIGTAPYPANNALVRASLAPTVVQVEINTGGVAYAKQLGAYKTGGWSTLLVRGTGISGVNQGGTFVASPSLPIPVFGVEVIYHLEGTPNCSDTSLVGISNVGHFDNATFVRAVERSSRELWFRRIVDYYRDPGKLKTAKGKQLNKKHSVSTPYKKVRH